VVRRVVPSETPAPRRDTGWTKAAGGVMKVWMGRTQAGAEAGASRQYSSGRDHEGTHYCMAECRGRRP